MHVRTVDPVRVVGYVGELNGDEWRDVQRGLALLLGLEPRPNAETQHEMLEAGSFSLERLQCS